MGFPIFPKSQSFYNDLPCLVGHAWHQAAHGVWSASRQPASHPASFPGSQPASNQPGSQGTIGNSLEHLGNIGNIGNPKESSEIHRKTLGMSQILEIPRNNWKFSSKASKRFEILGPLIQMGGSLETRCKYWKYGNPEDKLETHRKNFETIGNLYFLRLLSLIWEARWAMSFILISKTISFFVL